MNDLLIVLGLVGGVGVIIFGLAFKFQVYPFTTGPEMILYFNQRQTAQVILSKKFIPGSTREDAEIYFNSALMMADTHFIPTQIKPQYLVDIVFKFPKHHDSFNNEKLYNFVKDTEGTVEYFVGQDKQKQVHYKIVSLETRSGKFYFI